jgi:hypothetical protein
MSRGDRFKRIVAYLAGLLGTAFVAYGLIYGLSQQSRYVQIADDAAAKYASYAAYQKQQACSGVVAPKLAKCRLDAKAEYELNRADNRREYDDLVAQQHSALWTGIMGFAAITGMVISVVGIFLVYTTFRETKRSANAAIQSYEAFIKFEGATLIVYFSRDATFFEKDGNLWLKAKFKVRNMGRSPAVIHEFGFQGQKAHWYETVIAGGEEKELSEKFEAPVTQQDAVFGFLTYSTAIRGECKRVFLIGVGRADDPTKSTMSIHPGWVLYKGDEGYETPFEIK